VDVLLTLAKEKEIFFRERHTWSEVAHSLRDEILDEHLKRWDQEDGIGGDEERDEVHERNDDLLLSEPVEGVQTLDQLTIRLRPVVRKGE
jgi:hypothetical protein